MSQNHRVALINVLRFIGPTGFVCETTVNCASEFACKINHGARTVVEVWQRPSLTDDVHLPPRIRNHSQTDYGSDGAVILAHAIDLAANLAESINTLHVFESAGSPGQYKVIANDKDEKFIAVARD